ncbi:MAG: TonB family protein [Smithellaceae bacterium]
MPVASAIQREDYIQRGSCGEFPAFQRVTVRALTGSVIFHVAVAVVLYMFSSYALVPAISERPQTIHVTLVDASRFSGKNSLAVHSEKAYSRATEIQQVPNLQKEQPLPEKRTILSVHEEKKKTPVLNNTGHRYPAPGLAGQKSTATQTSRDSKNIVTLEHGLKTDGADNTATNTSKAKPRYRENAPPQYPLSARLREYEGVALIAAEILADGKIGNLKIKSSSGYSILDQSAVEAIKKWKFDPAREMGKPVSAWVEIPVRFVLKSNN